MKKEEPSKKDKKKQSKKSKGHYTILPYFKYAIIYVLISMIVVVPLIVGVTSKAVSIVHKAQTVMVADYSNLEVNNSTEIATEDYIDSIYVGKRLGTITFENAGVNENVYYGINRVTQRYGVGLDKNSYLFGEGGCSKIAGYSSSSLRYMQNASVGERITVDTSWGVFTYKIKNISNGEEAPQIDGDSLVVATFSNTNAFSFQSGQKLFVVAELENKEAK